MSSANPWKTILKTTAIYSSLGSCIYLIGLILIHAIGQDFSDIPAWWYRLSLIIFCSLSLILSKKQLGGYLSFPQGVGAGALSIFILSIGIAGGTYFFCESINPTYNEEAKAFYKDARLRQMAYVYREQTQQQKINPAGIDSLQSGLSKHMEQIDYFFTSGGQAKANFIYAYFWGFGIILTLAYLARKVKE